jgi:hypothetical protein
VSAGANMNARSSNKGKIPLELARDKGKHDVVALLQDHIRKRSRSKVPPKPESITRNRAIKVSVLCQ